MKSLIIEIASVIIAIALIATSCTKVVERPAPIKQGLRDTTTATIYTPQQP